MSISVASPTASSDEIILPNGNQDVTTNKDAGTLTLPAKSVHKGYTAFGVSVYTAWNCLLGK